MKFNWTSKSALAILVVLAVFLAQQKFRQYRLQAAIEKEKQNLEQRQLELEGKREELNKTLNYLNSKSYKEIIARQQLNMQKDGEIVYNFNGATNPVEPSPENTDAKTSNFQKWVNYFLNKK